MSLFGSRGAEQRAITSVPWWPQNYAPNDAGVNVNEMTALRLSAVWACVSLLKELIAAMPLDVYTTKNGVRVPVDNPPPIAVSPSLRGLSRRDWTAQATHSLLLRGNAYGIVMSRGRNNLPDAVEWVNADHVDVEETNGLAAPVYYLTGQPLRPDQIVHIRINAVPGSVVGMSPIQYQAQTLGVALAVQKFAAQWFGQGAHPSALLTTELPLKPDQADLMKKRWVAAIGGKREPAVMGAGIKYTPVQVAANESQFLETQAASVADIARIFKIPVELIGGSAGNGSSVTYANREQRSLDLLTFAVQPLLTQIEDAVCSMLPRGVECKFNVDSLLRSDLITRFEAHAIALQNHFSTLDEVRALEDMPPLNNGEQFPPAGSPPQKFQPKTAK